MTDAYRKSPPEGNGLVDAVDALLAFVQEHQEIKIDELPEFRELDTRVYVLAVQAGIQRELPDQAELFQLYDKDMPESAVYEGKCNLPGDWWPKSAFDPNRVFMTVPTGRWLDAMLSFRSLASTLPSSPANPEPNPVPAPDGGREAGKPPEKQKVNDRMAAMLMEDPSRVEWSAQKWADTLGCTKAAVINTETWKKIMKARALQRADRASRR